MPENIFSKKAKSFNLAELIHAKIYLRKVNAFRKTEQPIS